MVVCACNSRAREAEADASLGREARPQSVLRGCQHPAGVVRSVEEGMIGSEVQS